MPKEELFEWAPTQDISWDQFCQLSDAEKEKIFKKLNLEELP